MPNILALGAHTTLPGLEILKKLGLSLPNPVDNSGMDTTTQDTIANRDQSQMNPIKRFGQGAMEGMMGSSVLDNPNEDIHNAKGYGKAVGQILPLLLGTHIGNPETDAVDMFGYNDPEFHPTTSKMNYGIKTAPTKPPVDPPMQTGPINVTGDVSPELQAHKQKMNYILEQLATLDNPENINRDNPLANHAMNRHLLPLVGGSQKPLETQTSGADVLKRFAVNTGPSQYRPEGMERYLLPDGTIVPVDATASKGASTITYQMKGGKIVTAKKLGAS